MKRLITNREQVIANITTLGQYRDSDRAILTAYYKSLIALGTCFVVYQYKGETRFGPSRFIGYSSNTMRKHEMDHGDGRDTNSAIQRVLKARFLENPNIEKLYQQFCAEHGVQPSRKRRKFIAAGCLTISEFDSTMHDVKQIKASNAIKQTEKDQLVSARLGQGRFRESLFNMWGGCSVTQCKSLAMLRASHIKPWSACSNVERLDPFNGLLLIPNLDLALDTGLISFSDSGRIMISSRLSAADARTLGIRKQFAIRFSAKSRRYFEYHRKKIFKQ